MSDYSRNAPLARSVPAQPLGPAAMGLTLLTVALWGGTPTAVKYSQDVLPSMAIAAARFALAAAFMLLWCLAERTGIRLRAGQRRPAVVAGLLLFVQIGLFNLAIELSSASHSSLFINTFIFWVAGIEHFVTGTDRLSPPRVAGLLVAAAGALLILATTGPPPRTPAAADSPSIAGDLVMLASALVLGIKIVYTRHAVQIVEPGKLIFWHDVIGLALFAAWSAAFENADWRPFLSGVILFDDQTRSAALGLLYQGLVVAGFCFAVQARLLQKHSASKISVFSFATPLFGVTIAVLLRGDRLSGWLALAAACIAAGIVLVNRRSGEQRRR